MKRKPKEEKTYFFQIVRETDLKKPIHDKQFKDENEVIQELNLLPDTKEKYLVLSFVQKENEQPILYSAMNKKAFISKIERKNKTKTIT